MRYKKRNYWKEMAVAMAVSLGLGAVSAGFVWLIMRLFGF